MYSHKAKSGIELGTKRKPVQAITRKEIEAVIKSTEADVFTSEFYKPAKEKEKMGISSVFEANY